MNIKLFEILWKIEEIKKKIKFARNQKYYEKFQLKLERLLKQKEKIQKFS